ncbi:hypothetical protein GGI25_005130 [Coemansia spiralis]|uniref:Uncharacterized protein n=1 Tax=Coemansia spiralis TaxID=417178 RepID=A0A9W8G2V7_9FUNG|nr:hypothetical protein GGI25_005130 [Coemansia spiralis]
MYANHGFTGSSGPGGSGIGSASGLQHLWYADQLQQQESSGSLSQTPTRPSLPSTAESRMHAQPHRQKLHSQQLLSESYDDLIRSMNEGKHFYL